jgi:hypothetical protein
MEDSITLIFVFIDRAFFKCIQYTQKIGKLPFSAQKNDEIPIKIRANFKPPMLVKYRLEYLPYVPVPPIFLLSHH